LRYNTSFTVKEIKDSIDSIIDLEIEIVTPTKYLIHQSIEIARTDNITCYDAIFIALAVDIGDHVITADKKFHNSLSKEYKKHIKLLSDFWNNNLGRRILNPPPRLRYTTTSAGNQQPRLLTTSRGIRRAPQKSRGTPETWNVFCSPKVIVF